MQESEAARQEAAADLQRCYKEDAGLQAQLSSLVAAAGTAPTAACSS